MSGKKKGLFDNYLQKIADFLKLKNQKHLNYLKKNFSLKEEGLILQIKIFLINQYLLLKKKNLDLDICENILNLHI